MCFAICKSKRSIATVRKRKYVYKVVFEIKPGVFTGIYYSGLKYRLNKPTRLRKDASVRFEGMSRHGIYAYANLRYARNKLGLYTAAKVLRCVGRSLIYTSRPGRDQQMTFRELTPVGVVKCSTV